jgi:hypothetical protein
MLTSRRSAFVIGCFAVAVFSTGPAEAELPQHLHLQTLEPTAEELGNPDPNEFPFYEPSWFGAAVAVREGFAFIGMPLTLTTGRVAVFTQRAEGWVRTGTITASDMTSEDRFGQTLSYRDGLLVVGSRRAAYVYKQINGVWREQQKILPPAADAMSLFASDIKHQDGVLAIGGFGNGGYVYVYERDSSGKFMRRARLSARDDSNALFGTSIGMTKRIIVVGAIDAAYIFGRNLQGQWVKRQKLLPSDSPLPGAIGVRPNFGIEVAVDRDMILVGAPGAALPGAELDDFVYGAVYGFVPGDGHYVESFKLYPPLDRSLDTSAFGSSIAMFGERFAVAGNHSVWFPEMSSPGVIHTYLRVGSGAVPLGAIPVWEGQRASIGIANNQLIVGTPYGGGCMFEPDCSGEAEVYDLSRLEP